jgi:hypothetical protein
MAIGLVIPPTGCSTAQSSSSAAAETAQPQQHTPCGAFSTFLKDAIKNTDDEQAPSLSDASNPGEPTLVTAVDDQTTGASLNSLVVVSISQVPDTQKVASIVADKAESLPPADANASVTTNSAPSATQTSSPPSTGPTIQNIESTSLLLQGLTVVVSPDEGTLGHETVAANPPQPKTTVASSASLAQPALNLDRLSEVPATPVASPTTNNPVIRNGHGAPPHVAPVSLEQPSDASAPSRMRPPSPPIPEQGPSPNMEIQGSTNLPSTPQGQGQGQGSALVQSLARPSIDVRPSAMIQEQGGHETTLLSQSQSVRVIQDNSGGLEQGSFGDLPQGEGEGNLFQFNTSGVPESLIRGNQSLLFSDQFMSAQQTQSLPQGTGSPVVMSTTDHLKMTQSLLGGEHPATMSPTSGMPQTIHLELPSHDSGPLNVRISMMDQTVHTQFTTDRSDLGALLFMRQDQLQQNLTKSGLELGQFQVHVNQEGRQDPLPDRQSRRNDGMSDQQQPASQHHNPQAHDRDRPNHRPMRALSLFA